MKKKKLVDLEEIARCYAHYRLKFGQCLGQHEAKNGKQYCILQPVYGRRMKCTFVDKDYSVFVFRDKKRYYGCKYKGEKR